MDHYMVTDYKNAELYFLGYDYNKHKKKLFNMKSYFTKEELEELRKEGIKIQLLDAENVTDICIATGEYISTPILLSKREMGDMNRNNLDLDFYRDWKYFPLTANFRGIQTRFYDMTENFYSVSYEGDPSGQDYEDLLALNRAGMEDYFMQHGKYPSDDEDEEDWDFSLKFEYCDKNKALKNLNGEPRKKESCLKITDKMYYDLINANNITVKHIITFFTLQTTDHSSFSDRKRGKSEFVETRGMYPMKSLLDLKNYMDLDDKQQYFFFIHPDTYETDVIKFFSINIHGYPNHVTYYFHKTRLNGDYVMRVIRMPKLNMDVHARKLYPDNGKYVNGFCCYNKGIIFAGGQDDGHIINYALAQKLQIPIPDDVILNVKS